MKNKSIAKKLLVKILILSTVFTLMYTVLNLFLDYSSRKERLMYTINSIILSSQSSITKAVWNYDEEIIGTQAKSLLNHRDIISVKIVNSSKELIKISKENFRKHNSIEIINRKLNFIDDSAEVVDVGVLIIKFTKDFIQEEVIESLITFSIFQSIKTFVVSMGILYILNRFLISHVKTITEYFVSNSHLSKDKDKPLKLELSSAKKGMDEIDVLVSAVNSAINTNYKFIKEQYEKSILQSSLEAAEVVQESLLPKGSSKIPGVKIVSNYLPADRTGGDWYYYFYNESRKIAYFFCGDVTGHGIPSALVTAVCCGCTLCIQSLCNENEIKQEEILTTIANSLNHSIASTGSSCNRLMTMIISSLNVETGKMTILNAGHNHPFWYSSMLQKVKTLVCSGNRLGFTSEPTFRVKEIQLNPGDRVFLFTDGLVENTGPKGEYLSEKKLKDLLMSMQDQSLDELHSSIYLKLKGIWKENPAEDDVTTLFLQWDGLQSNIIKKAA